MTISSGNSLPKNDPNVVVGNLHANVRHGWRTAMSEFAYGLTYSEMLLVYDILQNVGDALLDLSEGPLRTRRGGDLIETIQQDIAHIRSEIGEYCMSAAKRWPANRTEQNHCDSIALREASFDVESNADLIAAIGARLVAKSRARRMEASND